MEGATFQSRQRSRRACHPCHQRKRKCDGEEPCGTCKGYGYECHYGSVGNKKTRARSKSPSTSSNKRPKIHRDAEIQRPRPGSHPSRPKPAQEGVLEPTKSRFVGAGSAIVFPMQLARELGTQNMLKLHSYAWNAGTRPEPLPNFGPGIVSMISWDEVQKFSAIYFATIHTVFDFVDQENYNQRCTALWNGSIQSPGFDATVSGVCALGSLFAGLECSQIEANLVQHAKTMLEDATVERTASSDHVAAWTLRTLYLRSTTRPHASWLSSCTTMHIAEAVGFHRELNTLVFASRSNTVSGMSPREKDYRRRTFWVAWSINQLFSCEYGRTAIEVADISCNEPLHIDSGSSSKIILLGKIASRLSSLDFDDFDSGLGQFDMNSSQNMAMILLEANLCFCAFRRLRLQEHGPTKEQIQKILSIGKMSLESASTLAAQGHVWWDVTGVPFHFVCILLAINSHEALSLLSDAMRTLEEISLLLQTHMAREAVRTARLLTDAAYQRKKRELDMLVTHLPTSPVPPADSDAQATLDAMEQEMPLSEWLWIGGADLDLFLDSMPGQD